MRASGGGNLRPVVVVDNAESSIGFYKYTDQRAVAAGDMCLAGQNCWNTIGYAIGTTTKDACFSLNSSGHVAIPYHLVIDGAITCTSRNSCFHVAGKADGSTLSI